MSSHLSDLRASVSLWFNRLVLPFRRSRADHEMAAEMRAHLDAQIERNLAAGMSADDARAAAHRQFGGVAQIQEQARDQRIGRWVENLARDLRYGWRGLLRQPGFTVVAVLTLGFGIGVNTTMFSFIEDLIARPTARDHTQHLAVAHLERRGAERGYRPFAYAEFAAVRDGGLFDRAAALRFSTARIGPKHDSHQRLVCLVSEDYFRVLGVSPWQGRFFHADETQPNADTPVIVASYVFWQRLGSRPDFVGSSVEIDGRSFTVIGITPRGFGGIQWSIGPDLWMPAGVAGWLNRMRGFATTGAFDAQQWQAWNVVGSLARGVSLETANAVTGSVNAALNALAGSRQDESLALLVGRPSVGNLDLTAPANEKVVGIYAAMVVTVTLAVLLLACLNVANMLLARGTAREKEIAVRLSLGATRARVVRQLITEGVLLGLAGGLVALVLSRVTNEAMLDFTRAVSSGQPFAFHLQTTTSPGLLAATFALALVATLVCSVVPALRATRLNLAADLKQLPGSAARAGVVRRLWSRRDLLVVLQVSLSVVLLFCAGLFVRCTINVATGRGFAVDGQVVVKVDYSLPGTLREDWPQRQAALAAQIAALPGVERVALASAVPYNFEANWRRAFAAGTGAPDARGYHGAEGIIAAVSDGYFDTLGIALLRGRDFTASESREPGGGRVAIIDENLARQLFGDADPLGRRFVFSAADARAANTEREIMVVGLIRSPQDDAFAPQHPPRIYLPLGQDAHALVYIHARAAQPGAVLTTLRRWLGTGDGEHPVLFTGLFSAIVDNNLNFWVLRTMRVMFGVFGAAAVLLAAVGVYGVKAYAVARRTREIGVRLALGATTRDVLGLILRQSATQALVGIGIGAVVSLVVGLGLSKVMYGVPPSDPLTLGLATFTAIAAVMTAAAVPAWRATRISPTEALRSD